MHDAKDKRVFLFNAVNDHYSPTARLRYGSPAAPGAVFTACAEATDVRARRQGKTAGHRRQQIGDGPDFTGFISQNAVRG
jgi:hypothetical protein